MCWEFLDQNAVAATTNNLTEQEVRPAAIARELSAGNRTAAGAEAHAVPAGLPRDYRRQGRSGLEGLTTLRRHGRLAQA